MRLPALFVMMVGWTLALPSLLAQTIDPSIRSLLTDPRPLTREEVSRVLDASRRALAGKRGRLANATDDLLGRSGTEFAIGPTGRLQFIRMKGGLEGGMISVTPDGPPVTTRWHREVVRLTHVTGQPARTCDGAASSGELMVDYYNEGSGWTATARMRRPGSPIESPFDVIDGIVSAESGDLQSIRDRPARAFGATWTMPGMAREQAEYRSDDLGRTWTPTAPPAMTQSLWIDTDSLLPVQWDVASAAIPERGIATKLYDRRSFRYDETIDIQPPADVARPSCIP